MRDDSFKDFIFDQLEDLDELDCRPMFGGYGLYQDDIFFGIMFKGRLYFKTDSMTVGPFIKMGMKPFRPNARQTLKNYYELPVDIIEDRDRVTEWARKAIQCGKK